MSESVESKSCFRCGRPHGHMGTVCAACLHNEQQRLEVEKIVQQAAYELAQKLVSYRVEDIQVRYALGEYPNEEWWQVIAPKIRITAAERVGR